MNIPSSIIWKLLFNEVHCPFIRHHSDFMMEEDRDELLYKAVTEGESGKKKLHDTVKQSIITHIELLNEEEDFQNWVEYELSSTYLPVDIEDDGFVTSVN